MEQKSDSLFTRDHDTKASFTSFKPLRQTAPRPLRTNARAFEEGSIPATPIFPALPNSSDKVASKGSS